MDTVMDRIRHFIVHDIIFKSDDSKIDIEDSLLEKGIIDSTGIIQLVTFLEKEFNIKVENQDLLPENFETVQSIAQLVKKRSL